MWKAGTADGAIRERNSSAHFSAELSQFVEAKINGSTEALTKSVENPS